MVRYQGRDITHVSLEEVVGKGQTGETSEGGEKFVDPEGQIVRTAKSLGISFGDE